MSWFTVRPVERPDAALWLELRCALWPASSRMEQADEIARFFDGRAREPLAVLIATTGTGSAIGFAELSIRAGAEGCSTDRVAYLEGWYVAPEARGHGVGRALIESAEAWGRSRGCTEFASDAEAGDAASAAARGSIPDLYSQARKPGISAGFRPGLCPRRLRALDAVHMRNSPRECAGCVGRRRSR